MRNVGRAALLCLLVSSGSAMADAQPGQPVPPPAASAPLPIVDAAPVPVNGLKAGPGLWQVRKGDNTLWVFGTVSPVPKGLEWYSPQAERVLARSRQIIGAPHVAVSVGMGGMFRAAFAMPTLLKARKNPDGKTLRDVLPAPLYARWTQLRQQYLPKDDDIEELRPSFAASKLYGAALERAGLVGAGAVYERIGAVVKQHDVERVSTSVKTEVKDVKGAAKTVIRSRVDETGCVREVLDKLEHDVAQATLRANAWAEGDVATLSALTLANRRRECDDTFFESELAAELGLADGRARSEAQWLKAVDTALERNRDTFAVLPMDSMLGETGWLERLRARGYEVVAPE
ncbi:TraB/GumN family protein [Aerolutibacter ruishenii]|uniref:TraB family protein n=1 Tax=Aerolutibacter ruishenii TaxID=686800 RepID=A0A562LSR5_9GAMM|nr:TraB/GumN family protein [Lysobacter ruishenii]TWI10681.1 TraB family protein [Lysobacter ruishenii]